MTTTETKTRPILFSGEMVKSLLTGRKTQTRRVVKLPGGYPGEFYSPRNEGGRQWSLVPPGGNGTRNHINCPYGAPGDCLWVRETWRITGGGTWWGVAYSADDGKWSDYRDIYQSLSLDQLGRKHVDRSDWLTVKCCGWKPSIHMPRWASRLTLEITSIRVERLQEMTESDAISEGASFEDNLDYDPEDPADDKPETHLAGFISLWDSLNAKKGYGWDTNPLVWVVEFQQITP